jgi:hypothetical protein
VLLWANVSGSRNRIGTVRVMARSLPALPAAALLEVVRSPDKAFAEFSRQRHALDLHGGLAVRGSDTVEVVPHTVAPTVTLSSARAVAARLHFLQSQSKINAISNYSSELIFNLCGVQGGVTCSSSALG